MRLTTIGAMIAALAVVGLLGWGIHGAIHQARLTEKQVRCADNLHAMYRAASAYADDHDGRWPDLYGEESIAWHDVGNTRADHRDPVTGTDPAGAEPANNELPVQSNTAGLWELVYYGVRPEQFICPAGPGRPDTVDVDRLRATHTAWINEKVTGLARWRKDRRAAVIARAEMEEKLRKEAGEKLLSEKARPEDEMTIEDLRFAELMKETLPEAAEEDEKDTGPKLPTIPKKPTFPRPEDLLRDFAGEPFCTYSYQNVLGTFRLERDMPNAADLAIVADVNPMRRDMWSGGLPAVGEKKAVAFRPADGEGTIKKRVDHGPTDEMLAASPTFIETEETRPWIDEGATITRPWELNSPNHAFAGQNVLYLDGHVAWTRHPYCGPFFDNIWQRQKTDTYVQPDPGQIAMLRTVTDGDSYNGVSTFGGDVAKERQREEARRRTQKATGKFREGTSGGVEDDDQERDPHLDSQLVP